MAAPRAEVSRLHAFRQNSIHGDVFEYIRNSAFDARNFFDTAKRLFRRNQFGARRRSDLETEDILFRCRTRGSDSLKGSRKWILWPSQAARNGQLCAPPTASTTTNVTVNPQIARFLDAFYPLPNSALLCPSRRVLWEPVIREFVTFAGQASDPRKLYFTTKIDHRFSANDLFYGTYIFDKR